MNNFDFQVIRFVTSEEINAWLNEIERIVKTKIVKNWNRVADRIKEYDYHKVVNNDLHGIL